MRRILACLLVLVSLAASRAQEPTAPTQSPQEERSAFLEWVESKLSAPGRQIRIENIQGILSSSATIGEITVADREGVWLRIVNAGIDWTRSALLLRRLEIQRLAAERIEVLRRPLPEEGLPTPEAGGFELPELPLAIILEALQVDRATFGADVFGLASEVSARGRLTLDGGSLDTALDITRLDGPGGQLALGARFANDTGNLAIDLTLEEPANGVVANLANIAGRPPIRLTARGEGPLDAFALALALDAAGQRALTGEVQLRRPAENLDFTARLSGPLGRLVEPAYRPFFEPQSTLSLAGTAMREGGVRVATFDLASGVLSLSGAGETTPDGFLRRLRLGGRFGGSGEPIVLPLPGGDKTLRRGVLDLNFGTSADGRWTGSLRLDGLDFGNASASRVAVEFGGLAERLDEPEARHVSFMLTGGAEGLASPRPEIAEALGTSLSLEGGGDWRAGGPVRIERAALSGKALQLEAQGELEGFGFDGGIELRAPALAPLSGLAGRDLGGAVDLTAQGMLEPLTGAFDLTLEGGAENLRLGVAALDRMFAGATELSGRLARGENGLTAEGFRIGNERASLTADGTYGLREADFTFDITLQDLALLSDKAAGRMIARGRAAGSEGRIGLSLTAQVPSGRLMERTLSQAELGFEGMQEGSRLTGDVSGSAFLGGIAARLRAGVALADGESRVDGLVFSAGGAALNGSLAQDRAGLLFGQVKVAASDLSTAAALFLTEARGAVNADIRLNAASGRQNATIRADAKGVVLGDTRIGAAEAQAAVEDLFGVPMAEGSLEASDATIAGIGIARLTANAGRTGEQTDFTAEARLANETAMSLAGQLSPEGEGYRLRLADFDLSQNGLTARLTAPASLLVEGRDITVDGLELDVGGGRLAASGTIADQLDLDLSIRDLPLAIANAIRPELRLAGTVNGTAKAAGEREAPALDFDLTATGIRAAALTDAGIGALEVKASGRSQGRTLALDSTISGAGGISATARGDVTLPDGALALDVALRSFPLEPLNALARGQDLKGRIEGTARIGGTAAAPTATFDLRGSGISAAPIAFAAPLGLTAEGRYENDTLILSQARASGPQGLALTASGRMPVSGQGLDLRVEGSAPLGLANRLLAERGTQLAGTLRIDAAVAGSLSAPVLSGQVSTSGARLVDPDSNVRLGNIVLEARLSGDSVTLSRLSAEVSGGGTVSGSGTVSIDAARGYPADLAIALRQARYADGELVTATVSGDLTVAGALQRDPLIAGAVRVERAEISLASSFGGGAARIDVKHIAPPSKVAATLARARRGDGPPMPTARPSIARLDIRIDAPNRIFVRGRGLDAEAGGSVRITGPVSNIVPVGSFDLIRGRLSILGKRITFDDGNVTLAGDLDPFVDLVARSESDDITVFITVRGRVSDPAIVFSSQPQLPQDEVLARLIFNRGLNELSPVQIAQLAAAAAELAGGGNNSLLSNLRGAAGLDDLDIVTDAEGNTAVRAGRYVRENVYLGVEAGASGTTRGTINLDITRNLKARGGVGSDGNTDMGIFFEKDY